MSVLYVDSFLASPLILFGALALAAVLLLVLVLTKENHGHMSLTVGLLTPSLLSLVIAGLSMMAIVNEDSKIFSTVETVYAVTIIGDGSGDLKDGGRDVQFRFDGDSERFRGHVELRDEVYSANLYKSMHEVYFTVINGDGESVSVEELVNEHNVNYKASEPDQT